MGILAFIIVLLFAADDAWGGNATIALGRTAFNSDSTFAEIGYETRDWEFNVGLIGAGQTKDGWQSTVLTYGVSKIVRPNWCFLGGCNYYRIGIAAVHGSPLVGPVNFRLGIGIDWGVFRVEVGHISSADLFETNTGIDVPMLKLEIPW